MSEWNRQKEVDLENLLMEAIQFADMGSRSAYKCIQSLKPRIDSALEKWSIQARFDRGPAK